MVFNAWRSRAGAGGVFAAMSGLRSRSCSFVQKIAIIEVHGYQKQNSGYGYSKVRGLNVFIATMKTVDGAPIILAQRLRRGPCWSPRGADRLIQDALATVRRLPNMSGVPVLFRAGV